MSRCSSSNLNQFPWKTNRCYTLKNLTLSYFLQVLQKRKLNPISQVQGWQHNRWMGSLSCALKQQPAKGAMCCPLIESLTLSWHKRSMGLLRVGYGKRAFHSYCPESLVWLFIATRNITRTPDYYFF